MAGGSPFEPYQIGPFQVPKYKLSLYFILGYTALATGVILYKKAQPAPPLKLDKDEENYIRRYIHHKQQEAKKPELARVPYGGPAVL